MDLDISNYNLREILKLFNLKENFSERDLLRAKQKVAASHPDKSSLHPDFFRFYLKAYKQLLSIWEFKNQNKKQSTNYDDNLSDERNKILNNYFENDKNQKKFNTWFNEEFEKRVNHKNDGYESWFRSNENIEEATTTQGNWKDINSKIERKKSELRQKVVYDDIQEFSSGTFGSSLDNSGENYYGSNMFSGLQYEDLQRAHTETVIPVTNEDFNKEKLFKNHNDLNAFRNNQNLKPLTNKEANNYFERKNRSESEQSTRLAYRLAKETEEQQEKEQSFFKSMRLLT